MKQTETEIAGVFILEPTVFKDHRGTFVKTFNKDAFEKMDLGVTIEECFYSVSQKNVVRGMHFHLPPKDHIKIIGVSSGSVTDTILDLRKNSTTYGKHITVELSQSNGKMVYIPKGCTHGFITHEDNTCTFYLQSGQFSKEHDAGIRVDSFDLSITLNEYIVSEKDLTLPPFAKFNSPF